MLLDMLTVRVDLVGNIDIPTTALVGNIDIPTTAILPPRLGFMDVHHVHPLPMMAKSRAMAAMAISHSELLVIIGCFRHRSMSKPDSEENEPSWMELVDVDEYPCHPLPQQDPHTLQVLEKG